MSDSPQAVPAPPAPKIPWSRRRPTLRRFVFWNIFCWLFGFAALVGGTLYTENIVRPMAEAGGQNFNPIHMLKKEEAAKRVFGNSDRLNILLLGIDYNHDSKGIIYTKGARSDTIVVMSLARDASFFNVVSIPRDTQVQIAQEIGYDKINSAYSYGGIQQARETVSDFLGIPIHHHVIIKVGAAKEVVDALGGLPIEVEKDMDYDDNWGHLHIHLKKGPQVLNGEQAVGYARFRMDEEGDRGRIRRQQQVIRALGRKLKEPALLSRLDEIAKVVQKNIETDFNILQMLDLANLYSSFDFAKMRSGAIVGDDAMDANGVSFIQPYEPENTRTVRRLLQDLDWLRKDDLRIRIYFKKAPSSIAYDLADRLYDAGFRGVQVEALELDSDKPTDTTRIVWYNEVPRLKGVVGAVVGKVAESVQPPPESRDDDLAIFIGDQDPGQWKAVPKDLLKDKNMEPSLPEEPRELRYQPEYIPRSLPPSEQEIDEPYEPEPPTDPQTFEESVQPEYPTSNGGATEPALDGPDYQPEPEIEAPAPTEVTPSDPLPAATPIN